MSYELHTRSLGIKLIAVGAMALVMTVPALFVDNLVQDRSRRAAEVSKSVGSLLGGPQTFLGPVLAVPYTLRGVSSETRAEQGVYIIFPLRGEAEVTTKSEVRHRSLFKVPVYAAAIRFKAFFDLAAPSKLPAGADSIGAVPSSSPARPIREAP